VASEGTHWSDVNVQTEFRETRRGKRAGGQRARDDRRAAERSYSEKPRSAVLAHARAPVVGIATARTLAITRSVKCYDNVVANGDA